MSGELGACRVCERPLAAVMADLGEQPLANSYLTFDDLQASEPHFPLRACVCSNCWLVQLDHAVDPHSIFRSYSYFSSVSETWLQHGDRFAASMISQLSLDSDSMVVEVASNDGYLLKSFASRQIPVLGIEPAQNVAQVANQQGIQTVAEFLTPEFARTLVSEGLRPDLVIGNNVLAHVPDLNSFSEALAQLMHDGTLLTLEFPHLLNMIREGQFDTIYHEHYSYLSVHSVDYVFHKHGLVIVDVEHLPTHGGSLRLHVRLKGAKSTPGPSVEAVRRAEVHAGLTDLGTYREFADRITQTRTDLRRFLEEAASNSKLVVGYGAAAKGNTMLNSISATPKLVPFVVDRSPHKQGFYLPGSHIPIKEPEALLAARPDFVLILPWNLVDEITAQLHEVREWGSRFVVAIPELRVF